MLKLIRIQRGSEAERRFEEEFRELTGVAYPPTVNQWMDILQSVGRTFSECRQFLQYPGYPELSGQDVSCSVADGYPTFTQSLMNDLRRLKGKKPEDIASDYSEPLPKWFVADALEISVDTLKKKITNNSIRVYPGISKASKIIRVHIDDLPPSLRRENDRKRLLQASQKKRKPT